MVTITDIAKRVGVTPKTVSAVLNNRYQAVHPKAVVRAEHIRNTARQLGYRPNPAARAAQAGRFGAIGILMSTSGKHSILEQIIDGIQETICELNLGLRFCPIPDEEIDDEHIAHLMQNLGVDGVLVNYTYAFPPQLMRLLEEHGIPAVWVNVKQDHDCVHTDDYGASRLAVEKLIAIGHRRISYVTHSFQPDGHYSAVDRHAGYCHAMQQAGLTPVSMDYRFTLSNTERNDILMPWLEATRPTAVHTQSLSEALCVHSAVERLGLRVPDDLSILTIHHKGQNQPGPQIDAVYLSSKQAAGKGVRMLAEKISNPRTSMRSEVIPSTFSTKVCSSLAPPMGDI